MIITKAASLVESATTKTAFIESISNHNFETAEIAYKPTSDVGCFMEYLLQNLDFVCQIKPAWTLMYSLSPKESVNKL